MRKFLGLTLLCAGLGFAAYTHYPASVDREQKLATVTRIIAQSATAGLASTVASEQPGFRQPLPTYAQAPLSGQSDIPKSAPGSVLAAAEPSQPVTAAATVAPTAGEWRTTVAAVTAPNLAPPQPIQGTAAERRELALNLQRELKRVGCYRGTVDGIWRSSSKRAMARFIDRVNASLPVTEPDVILLTLIRGHRDGVCGAGCPAGQVMSGGRCALKTVVAQVQPAKPPVDVKSLASVAKVKRDARPHTVAAGMEPKAVTAPAVPAPAVKTPIAIAAADGPVDIAPLPGRMSVGGPSRAPDLAASSAQVEVLPWQRAGRAPPVDAPAPMAATRANEPAATKTAALITEPASQHLARAEATLNDEAAPDNEVIKPGAPSVAPKRKVSSFAQSSPPRRVQRARQYRSYRPVYAYRFNNPPRPTYRRRYGSRSVHALFLHPLGRL